MKKQIVFVCDVCGESDSNQQHMLEHESFCLRKQEIEQKKLARRIATGQLTIQQIIDKCESLPDLPVIIASDSILKYSGKYPDGTDSYRGYYNELAIDIGDKVITLSSFLSEIKASLHHCYSGYKGGDYYMSKDTFVWLAEYGELSRIIIIDVRLAAGGEVVYLCVRKLADGE